MAWGALKNSVSNYSGQGFANPLQKANSDWNNLKQGKFGNIISDSYKQTGGTELNQLLGFDTRKQKQLQKEQEASRNKFNQDTRSVLDTMAGSDNTFIGEINDLRQQAQNQAKNAQYVYSNDIAPRLKNIMESAQMDASSAMTLEEAGDVNNYMHQQVRDLYGREAEGVRRQALADQGVMQALGAQATANQMGAAGSPLTNAQIQLLGANNQQQGALAYARAQQEMDRLREQGIERGFSESSNQYERGQRAIDRYQGSVANYEGAMDRDINRQRGFRGEDYGYGQNMNSLRQGISNRDLGYLNQVQSGDQAFLQQQIAQRNAENAARSQLLTSQLQAGGTVAGAIIGGYTGNPQLSQAGGQAGGATGQAMAAQGQTANSVNYQNYGPYQDPAAYSTYGNYPQQSGYQSYGVQPYGPYQNQNTYRAYGY